MHPLEHNYSCCHIIHILMQDLAQVDFFVEEVGVGVISYILGKSFLMNTRK